MITSFSETPPAEARLDVFFLAAAYRDVLKDRRPDVIWSATHIGWHSQNIMNMIAGCNYVRSRDKEGRLASNAKISFSLCNILPLISNVVD
jgi:hypothetical protein